MIFPETLLESLAGGFSETPANALNAISPSSPGVNIIINCFNDVVAFAPWLFGSQESAPLPALAELLYDTAQEGYIQWLSGTFGVDTLYVPVDDTGLFSLSGTVGGNAYRSDFATIDNAGNFWPRPYIKPFDGNTMLVVDPSQILGYFDRYVQIFSSEDLPYPYSPNFDYGGLIYPSSLSPHDGETIIPPGAVENSLTGLLIGPPNGPPYAPVLNVAARTITMQTLAATPPAPPMTHYDITVHGFAVYPVESKACIVFCPALLRGVVSFHDIDMMSGLLKPATTSILIDNAFVGANPGSVLNPDWGFPNLNSSTSSRYMNGDIYFPPGPGAKKIWCRWNANNQDSNGTFAGSSPFSYEGNPATSSDWWTFGLVQANLTPTAYNFATASGQVICLWLFDTLSDLPTVNFNPDEFNLMVVK